MNVLEKAGVATLAAPVVAALLAVTTAYSLLCGYVAQSVWAWHIVPIATWIPVLTWKHFWALGAVRGMSFSRSITTETEKETAKVIGKLVGLAVAPALVLLVGWWLR